jgi:hypothetical protein
MPRLTLPEFIITIAILLTLAFGASWALRQWLLNVASETKTQMTTVSY